MKLNTTSQLLLKFFFISILVFAASCETTTLSELTPPPDASEQPAVVTYNNTARTILDNSCVECHNVTDATAGIVLDNFEDASMVAASGRMLFRMTNTTNPMPPSGNLPPGLIASIMQWIDDGILEN